MGTVFVARDESGGVIEVAAVPQPGRAVEALRADHPDVRAFEMRVAPTAAGGVRRAAASSLALSAMVDREARRLGVTRQQVIDDLAADAG